VVKALALGSALFIAAAHTAAAMNGFCPPWTISVSCGFCWLFGTFWGSA
jgi:hypothetical protein